jgi:hypothetical protein
MSTGLSYRFGLLCLIFNLVLAGGAASAQAPEGVRLADNEPGLGALVFSPDGKTLLVGSEGSAFFLPGTTALTFDSILGAA